MVLACTIKLILQVNSVDFAQFIFPSLLPTHEAQAYLPSVADFLLFPQALLYSAPICSYYFFPRMALSFLSS